MKFHDRLSRILRAKKTLEKKSASYYADLMGVHKTSFGKWANGKTEPDLETMTKLATVLNVPLSELTGGDQPTASVDLSKWGVLKIYTKIPVTVALEDIRTEGEIAVPPEEAKPGYFAYKIQDDSMLPRLMVNDIAIIAPSSDPQDGQIVAVRINDEGDVVVRRLQRGDGLLLLVPENPLFKALAFLPLCMKILGAVLSFKRYL